jgi:transposase
MTGCVGIDVSKATLDWADTQGDSGSVPNDENGYLALIEALNLNPPERIVMEATGGYEIPAQLSLRAALPKGEGV